MSRAAVTITLSSAERRELESLAGRRKTAQGLARRARIILAAARGLENKAIVEYLGVDANTVGKWRRRFAQRRLDGLYDEPRAGAPRRLSDTDYQNIAMQHAYCRLSQRQRTDPIPQTFQVMQK